MSKFLIIEDDKIKIEKLSLFFEKQDFEVRESYYAGLNELLSNSQHYNLLILDMSIPLWDRGNVDLGGNFEQFGGVNILREMKRKKKMIPTIILTMFDVFADGKLTFDQLNSDLLNQFPDFYYGAIFYNASEDKWKTELQYLIQTIKL